MQKLRDQHEGELADKDHVIDKLRSEAQLLLQRELHDRASEHLRLESEHQERVQLQTLELAHMRDHLSEKDQLIHSQRLKLSELQTSNEQLTLSGSRQQSELQRQLLEVEAANERLRGDLERVRAEAAGERAEMAGTIQTLRVEKERMEHEMRLMEERNACREAVERQRHELEKQRQQAESGSNIEHLQQLIRLAQDEAERYRVENELLQRSLAEQEASSRSEIDEVQ